MIHILLVVAFIILLVAKLAGAAISWWLVFAPIIAIVGFWTIVLSFIRWFFGKLDKKYRKLSITSEKAKF